MCLREGMRCVGRPRLSFLRLLLRGDGPTAGMRLPSGLLWCPPGLGPEGSHGRTDLASCRWENYCILVGPGLERFDGPLVTVAIPGWSGLA